MKSTISFLLFGLMSSSSLIKAIPLHHSAEIMDPSDEITEHFSFGSVYEGDDEVKNSPDSSRHFNAFERDPSHPHAPLERHSGIPASQDVYRRGSPAPAARPPTTGRGPGAGGAAIGDAIANTIDAAQHEPQWRGDFVKKLIADTTNAHPGFQAIACHTKHTKQFQGKENEEWGHSHAEYTKQATPGTIGYEIYWFKKGTFENQGDGGWQNWGYTGSPKMDGPKKLTYT